MPRRNARAKAPKDLNAPKRPLSGYMLFNQNRLKTLRAEQPDKKITELTKVIGAEWKTLTAEQKSPYETEAQELKEKFKVAMTEYKESESYRTHQEKLQQWKQEQLTKQMDVDDDDDELRAVPMKVQKRPKDPNAPKKPLTAFFLFVASRRAAVKEANPEVKVTEITKILGAEWKALTAEAKQPFEQQAREKKDAYNAELAAYKQTENYTNYQATLAAWKASLKKAKGQSATTKRAPAKENKPSNRATVAAVEVDDDDDETASDSDSSEEESSDEQTPPARTAATTSRRNFGGSSSEEDSSEDDNEDEEDEQGGDDDGDVEMTKSDNVQNGVAHEVEEHYDNDDADMD